jgi:predicted transcriptional regulator
MLQEQRIDPRELDEVLRNLRRLDDDGVYQDVSELTRLQSEAAEAMKRFEYGLRRQVEGQDAQVVLSGADEVPESFRKMVEQYYRSLSKAPERK